MLFAPHLITMLQWAHIGVRVPAGICSAICTRVSSSLGWGWGTGRAGAGPRGTLALPLPFIPKDGVIKPVCGPTEGGRKIKDVPLTFSQKTTHILTDGVCICVTMFSCHICKQFDLYPLWLYTQQVSWSCMQLAVCCCHSQGFTTSIFSCTLNFSAWNTFLCCMCIHAYDQTHIDT